MYRAAHYLPASVLKRSTMPWASTKSEYQSRQEQCGSPTNRRSPTLADLLSTLTSGPKHRLLTPHIQHWSGRFSTEPTCVRMTLYTRTSVMAQSLWYVLITHIHTGLKGVINYSHNSTNSAYGLCTNYHIVLCGTTADEYGRTRSVAVHDLGTC